LETVQEELQIYNDRMRKHDAHIHDVVDAINNIKKRLKEADLKKDALKKDLHEMRRSVEDSHLEKKHKWISDEKRHFGRTGTAYDFTNYTIEKGKHELEERLSRKQYLERTINCRQLELKKEKLESDKATLMQTIVQLDRKKEKEIFKAHEKVNRDFGNIFSTLLPGTTAKLEPPPGASSALQGLEVKVAFSNKWKDSLGELSGGQRSLVALSLVLAMLKFKPAPIYILDEVDAALDLSHTQNIGAMIKTHFKESQFIIVSLKDGMFNHANVLFKTRFVDGTSTVIRTENRDQWVIENPQIIPDLEKENDDVSVAKRAKRCQPSQKLVTVDIGDSF
uniref:SMC_N domain-containing protein n=1 Tax=Dracunculus medinensis TaxID=318479 RepID=A0A0N4UFC7_DRAME